MKSEVDELDIGNLNTTPTDLRKLTDVVKKDVKKTEHDKLFKKINSIQVVDTSNFIKKADYDTNIDEIEKK